jgi:hypothetical protein
VGESSITNSTRSDSGKVRSTSVANCVAIDSLLRPTLARK